MSEDMRRAEGVQVDVSALLAEKRDRVWPVIESFLRDEWAPLVHGIGADYPDVATLHERVVVEYPRRRGKYLRPALVLLTCAAMGAPESLAVNTAAAMQVSEDWLLIHDDWEDGSTHRRGDKALHEMYGPELAVNAGDALHIVMWKILLKNRSILGIETSDRIFDEFYRMLTRTALGQTVEIAWIRENRLDLTDDDWFFVADGKTSYYTIAGPMRLGALIADASEEQLEQFFAFGRLLGRCFQIADDVLDLTSDFQGLKAQRGNDVYEGKRTLPLLHLLRAADDVTRRRVVEIIGRARAEKGPGDVEWVIQQMHRFGSIEYARASAARLADAALAQLDTELTFLRCEPARQQLRAAVEFLHQRES
jgi:geranylgeranyl diphosphate synthase type II